MKAKTPRPTVRKTATKTATKKSAGKRTVARAAATSPKEAAAGEDLLWQIVERVRKKSGGELDASCAAFRAELSALDDSALQDVEAAFSELMQRAYDWGLWGAAYVIHGGCSDDAFWDFRAGLVALGRDVYQTALGDPDSLADVELDIEEATCFEGFQYVPSEVLEARKLESTGGDHSAGKPTGKRWKEADLEDRFPKLTARFE